MAKNQYFKLKLHPTLSYITSISTKKNSKKHSI